jgi:hypothetical protein
MPSQIQQTVIINDLMFKVLKETCFNPEYQHYKIAFYPTDQFLFCMQQLNRDNTRIRKIDPKLIVKNTIPPLVDIGFHPDMQTMLSFMIVALSSKINHPHYVEALYLRRPEADVFTPFYDKYDQIAQTTDLCEPAWIKAPNWKFMVARYNRQQQEKQTQTTNIPTTS